MHDLGDYGATFSYQGIAKTDLWGSLRAGECHVIKDGQCFVGEARVDMGLYDNTLLPFSTLCNQDQYCLFSFGTSGTH